MSKEIKTPIKLNIDTIAIRKFRARDLNGSTAFSLSSGTWSLRDRSDGSEIIGDDCVVNNSDIDLLGNQIATVSMTINLNSTDGYSLGSYYLVIETVLATSQTDIFRVPVELVDFRTKKGAA